jgi:predicted Zn-dependent protease
MDVINIENQFNKALRLLDFGKIEKASDILNEIIIEATKEQNYLFFIRASCVLGELLFSNGKAEEAKQHLINVVSTPYENDVVDYEKSVASNILIQIQ